MKRTAVLAIDLQNDFTSPEGNLFVNGAEQDIAEIIEFICNQGNKIDYIALTLDSHQPIHIANQVYWKDENGFPPPLYTNIHLADVINKRWIPQYNQDKVQDYLYKLEAKGETCTIWPPHCIAGSRGWCIDEKLITQLYRWCVEHGKSYELFYKGFHQATEHYSIFRAAANYEDAPETHFNRHLLDKLDLFDEIIIVGEAADFCVASSLQDMLEEKPEMAKKTVIFTNCMSWIISGNPKAVGIYENAEEMGVRFESSKNYMF